MGKRIGMTMQNKMFVSYFAIILLLIATGVIGILYVRQVYNNGKHIYENDLKAVEYLKSISQNIKELDRSILHCIIDVDWVQDEDCTNEIDVLMVNNEQLMQSYYALDISDKEIELYEKGKASVLEYHQQIRDLVSKMTELDESECLKIYENSLLPLKESTSALIEEAVSVAIAHADESNVDNHNIYNKIVWIICAVMLGAIVIAILISISMSNYIISKLKSIQFMAKRISEYNISDDIDEFDNDEFGQTVEALNESQFMIRELLEKIIGESAVISDMGEEVSLAVRKSEQRIEQVNVRILEYDKIVLQIEGHVRALLNERTLDEEETKELERLKQDLYEAKSVLENVRTELSSVAIYLEQIGITSDYQNEIANSHKEQVKRFKIKESEE